MENRDEIEKLIDSYLDIFGNKWNLLILYELYDRPQRFNELKRALSPITQTVLARHLKSLEDNGVVERQHNSSDQTVYYSISKEGYAVVPSMINTYDWLRRYVPEKRDESQ